MSLTGIVVCCFPVIGYCQMFDYNMSIRLSLLLGLAVALNAISLTVSSLKERCMIVSSNNNEHLLKTDLKFQRFSNQALEEGYRVVLHNT